MTQEAAIRLWQELIRCHKVDRIALISSEPDRPGEEVFYQIEALIYCYRELHSVLPHLTQVLEIAQRHKVRANMEGMDKNNHFRITLWGEL